MIFSILFEEFGVFGASAVILLFVLLLWRCMVIANNAPDLFEVMSIMGEDQVNARLDAAIAAL